MIKTVIKCQSGMVMVFDERGEQVSRYQGQYEEIKKSIVRDASPETIFGYLLNNEAEILKTVPREEW